MRQFCYGLCEVCLRLFWGQASRRFCGGVCKRAGGKATGQGPTLAQRRALNKYLIAEVSKLETYKQFLRHAGISFEDEDVALEALMTHA